MGEIVGVVPNFSEGRRRDVIDAIVGALGVEGARVVFAEADPDHHRLDTTVLGTADGGAPIGDRRSRRRDRPDRHVRAPRRASADGRGRRGAVHAGPRTSRWPRASTWLARSAGSWRRRSRCPSTCTARPRPRRSAVRSPTSGRVSSRGSGRPSPRGSGSPTSGRTRSGGRARRPSERGSRSWRSTPICPGPTSRRRRTSPGGSANRPAGSPPSGRSGSRSRNEDA